MPLVLENQGPRLLAAGGFLFVFWFGAASAAAHDTLKFSSGQVRDALPRHHHSAKSTGSAVGRKTFKTVRRTDRPDTDPQKQTFKRIIPGQPKRKLAGLSETAKARELAKRYQAPLRTASVMRHLEQTLILAVIRVESGGNPRAVSPKGAQGLMQLMPATARRFGVRDSFDPAQNIAGGARYLSELLKMFDGNQHLALAAYNAGENAVLKYGGIPPYAETQHYVKAVTALHKRLKADCAAFSWCGS